MDSLTSFELRGCFGGFFRTVFGKRRIILRVAGEEHELKLPKELRHEFADALVPGVEIAVHGHVHPDAAGRTTRVIEGITFLTAPALGSSGARTLRLCAKKNCWKQGGKELWRALETEIAARALGDEVRLKAVSCLDNCKHAPNLECGPRLFERCRPGDVAEILAQTGRRSALSTSRAREAC